jgi:hypothetical protein
VGYDPAWALLEQKPQRPQVGILVLVRRFFWTGPEIPDARARIGVDFPDPGEIGPGIPDFPNPRARDPGQTGFPISRIPRSRP